MNPTLPMHTNSEDKTESVSMATSFIPRYNYHHEFQYNATCCTVPCVNQPSVYYFKNFYNTQIPNNRRKNINHFIQKQPNNDKLLPVPQQNDQASAIQCDDQKDNESSENQNGDLLQKTPMFLINEIARFNKIQIQYVLENEIGPAHNKTFFIKLKLGNDEEYQSTGSSIKKAQQSAAKTALEKTKYQSPKKRTKEKNANLTPTVQLNSMAMKFGYEAKYTFTNSSKRMVRSNEYISFTSNEYSGPFSYPKSSKFTSGFNHQLCDVVLNIGDKIFHSAGTTRQQAKHNAAAQALTYLSTLKTAARRPENFDKSSLENENRHVEQTEKISLDKSNEKDLICPKSGDPKIGKSEISLVQEAASRRKLVVTYELIQESGPSHIRKYVTRCSVGDDQTTGEGNSKKDSKKNAAIKMLEELKIADDDEVCVDSINSNERKKPKKRAKNIIKIIKENPDYGKGSLNPICRLIQIQQVNKGAEPVYKLIEERKKFRKFEFIMQVFVGENSCIGNGNSKRKAKQNAAEAMLVKLGYQPTDGLSQRSQIVPKPVLKTRSSKQTQKSNDSSDTLTEKRVKFVDLIDEKTEGNVENVSQSDTNSNLFNKNKKGKADQFNDENTLNTACLIANDLLTKGSSELINYSLNQSSTNVSKIIGNEITHDSGDVEVTDETATSQNQNFCAALCALKHLASKYVTKLDAEKDKNEKDTFFSVKRNSLNDIEYGPSLSILANQDLDTSLNSSCSSLASSSSASTVILNHKNV